MKINNLNMKENTKDLQMLSDIKHHNHTLYQKIISIVGNHEYRLTRVPMQEKKNIINKMYKKNLYNQIDSSLHNKRGLLINLYEDGNFLNLTNL